jgi:hypothetical protein
MSEHLDLKWGTVKGWSGLSEASQEIMKRFFADGMCMSAMADHPDENRRRILCELIDQLDGVIWNDWDDVEMTKDEAKRYVTEYGVKS